MALVRAATALVAFAVAALLGIASAAAVEAVNVRLDAAAIDLTDAVEFQHTDGDRVQVSIAPGPDGIARRIEVRRGKLQPIGRCSHSPTTATSRSTAYRGTHYRMVGSGMIWPIRHLGIVVSRRPRRSA